MSTELASPLLIISMIAANSTTTSMYLQFHLD